MDNLGAPDKIPNNFGHDVVDLPMTVPKGMEIHIVTATFSSTRGFRDKGGGNVPRRDNRPDGRNEQP